MNLNLSPNVTTIMTVHGNTRIRSYLNGLKIIGSPECPCKPSDIPVQKAKERKRNSEEQCP